jgi:arylsulfatase A-like enzyme
MDVAWIIIDGLSYSATPFPEGGPNTLPRIKQLADKHGVVFSNAYAPGPLSPSSHASMFTGQLPSAVDMHEARPYFDSDAPTIATALHDSHQTHLVTGNEWLFQGLDEDFDETFDFGRQYLIFREALDPGPYFHGDNSRVRDFIRDSTNEGGLIKSFANAVNYRINGGYGVMPKGWGDSEEYQYAKAQTNEVRKRLESDEDSCVVANYMDVHAPIKATEEAIEKFSDSSNPEELPVKVSPERHIPDSKKSYDVDRMGQLYKAAIWDVDRKISPLIEELIEDEVLVILTSDHGRIDTGTAYSDTRLHVPLVIFSPDEDARRVSETVSIRSIPKTITDAVNVNKVNFDGTSLLDIKHDQTAITEIIHHPNEVYQETHRVDITRVPGEDDRDIQHDIVIHEGDARGEHIQGNFTTTNTSPEQDKEFEDICEKLIKRTVKGTREDGLETDPVTEERLEDLGYI